MPKAPADYQLRYPIDFGDIDPSFRQRPVQLYAADFGKSRGIFVFAGQRQIAHRRDNGASAR